MLDKFLNAKSNLFLYINNYSYTYLEACCNKFIVTHHTIVI